MMFEGKTILVTGATGLIGYNLVCRLLREGVSKVYATGRSLNKLECTFETFKDAVALHLIVYDAAQSLPEEIKDVDYIFHAAGPMERDIVLNKPVDVILPNIIGTINCLEFLKKQESETGKKGRIVIFSSVTVYNNPTSEDFVVTENDTNYAISLDAPTACYSESKRMAEVIAKSYVKQYNIDAVIARFSTVYGPTKNIPNTAFYEFIKKSILGQDIIINNSTIPRRDNIFIDDAIEGLIVVAQCGVIGESYNISSNGELGNFAAIDEIAQVVAAVANTGSKVKHNEMKVTKRGGLKLDSNKLKELGWKCETSLEKGIIKTITPVSGIK